MKVLNIICIGLAALTYTPPSVIELLGGFSGTILAREELVDPADSEILAQMIEGLQPKTDLRDFLKMDLLDIVLPAEIKTKLTDHLSCKAQVYITKVVTDDRIRLQIIKTSLLHHTFAIDCGRMSYLAYKSRFSNGITFREQVRKQYIYGNDFVLIWQVKLAKTDSRVEVIFQTAHQPQVEPKSLHCPGTIPFSSEEMDKWLEDDMLLGTTIQNAWCRIANDIRDEMIQIIGIPSRNRILNGALMESYANMLDNWLDNQTNVIGLIQLPIDLQLTKYPTITPTLLQGRNHPVEPFIYLNTRRLCDLDGLPDGEIANSATIIAQLGIKDIPEGDLLNHMVLYKSESGNIELRLSDTYANSFDITSIQAPFFRLTINHRVFGTITIHPQVACSEIEMERTYMNMKFFRKGLAAQKTLPDLLRYIIANDPFRRAYTVPILHCKIPNPAFIFGERCIEFDGDIMVGYDQKDADLGMEKLNALLSNPWLTIRLR